jgi:photosystem II stability/assembly factor-like uncharacterized protein
VGVVGPGTGPDNPATVIAATKDAGAHWKPQPVSGTFIPQLSAVSCPDVAHCMAVGSNGASVPGSGAVFITVDGGVKWTPATAPSGVLTVESVVCPTPSQCTVIVNDGAQRWSARSADFGRTWQRMGNLPSGFVGTDALSCPTDGPCLIGGYTATGTGHGQGAIALSPDGGQTWTPATVPAGIGLLQDATCLTVSVCLAAGSTSTTVSDVVPAHGQLLRSVDGGHTWAAATAPPVDAVYGIACPTARVCALVGANWTGNPTVATGAVAQSGDGGATFASSPSAYVPLTLVALDCPTAAHCVAAGGATVARITLVKPVVHHRSAHTSTTSSTAGAAPGG